jgi:hypothetical protein
MSMFKRQREQGKREKAARKRAKRHGFTETGLQEPVPTIGLAELLGQKPIKEEESADGESAD